MAHSGGIRILLVDDHSVVRMGLAAVLSLDEGLLVVAEAEDGAQAIEKFRTEKPDVVLMDVRMPGMNGLDALRALRAATPGVRVLMLTTSELDEDIQQAIEAGAAGYLQKSVTRDELVRAVRCVHAGGRYVPEATARRLAQLAKRRHLSHREIEVLDGMRRGLSNRDIALSLSISEHTVKAHVKAVLQKLESADRAEAVARGFEQGLLRVGE
ncbi:MAG: response regulator transcription factor [Opitutaceae bacterium]|nr:response regulator transcription factor [Opitutaceae bacterium]